MVLAKFMDISMLPEKYKSLTQEQMETRIREIKDKLGEELFILGIITSVMRLFNSLM